MVDSGVDSDGKQTNAGRRPTRLTREHNEIRGSAHADPRSWSVTVNSPGANNRGIFYSDNIILGDVGA